jgi:hypothetical protein
MSSPVLPRHLTRTRRPLTTPDPPPVDGSPEQAPTTDGDRVAALEVEVAQLRAAMASRAAIEQAKGILMLLTGCTDEVAFQLLSHISGHTHRKVREVAQAITGSASGSTALPADIQAIIRDACPPVTPRD